MSRQKAGVLAKDFQCVWVHVGFSIAVRPDTLTHLSSAGVIRRIRIFCTRLNAPRILVASHKLPDHKTGQKGETKSRSLSIYVAPVADPHNQNERAVILDLTNDTAVPYPITPKSHRGDHLEPCLRPLDCSDSQHARPCNRGCAEPPAYPACEAGSLPSPCIESSKPRLRLTSWALYTFSCPLRTRSRTSAAR